MKFEEQKKLEQVLRLLEKVRKNVQFIHEEPEPFNYLQEIYVNIDHIDEMVEGILIDDCLSGLRRRCGS